MSGPIQMAFSGLISFVCRLVNCRDVYFQCKAFVFHSVVLCVVSSSGIELLGINSMARKDVDKVSSRIYARVYLVCKPPSLFVCLTVCFFLFVSLFLSLSV